MKKSCKLCLKRPAGTDTRTLTRTHTCTHIRTHTHTHTNTHTYTHKHIAVYAQVHASTAKECAFSHSCLYAKVLSYAYCGTCIHAICRMLPHRSMSCAHSHVHTVMCIQSCAHSHAHTAYSHVFTVMRLASACSHENSSTLSQLASVRQIMYIGLTINVYIHRK